MLGRLLQFLNAIVPILVTLFGMVILVKLLQLLNVSVFNDVMLSDRTILFRLLQPLKADHHATHQAFLTLLEEPEMDRAALEQFRADGLMKADIVSRTMAASFADISDVLTPEQRQQLLTLRKQFKH